MNIVSFINRICRAGISSSSPNRPVFFHIPVRDNGKGELQARVPFRQMASAMEKRLNKVVLYRDLPRGRKRPGWKKEFMALLRQAASQMGNVSEEEILKEVAEYRKARTPR
ncbi:MAG TPA: hypothetical protein VG759_09130 [Candidatus Angelobacter sp.]|nr:hypothetical protein [Candidatus Angelobacter sp.]